MVPKANETIEDVLRFINIAKIGIVNKTMIEFGIWIKESAHHHGHGLEAVQCLYEHVKALEEYGGFLYPVDRRNRSSRRIGEALGGVCNETSINFCTNGNGEDLELITYYIAK